MNKSRITYRFDPEGARQEVIRPREDKGKVIPLYEEEFRVEEEASPPSRLNKEEDEEPVYDYRLLNRYSGDYGAWSSPYDAETRRIEDLIRESNLRRGEGTSNRESGPVWDSERGGRRGGRGYLPDETVYDGETGYYETESGYRGGREEVWEGPVVTGPHYVRHSRPPWLKITASIAGAAVTGVLLGFLVLSMFNETRSAEHGSDQTVDAAGRNGSGQEQNAVPAAAGADTGGKKADAGGAEAAGAASGKTVAVSYAGKTYTFLQNGTFAAEQGAEQAKEELLKKGLAAVSEQADKFYVYAGVAADRDSALSLSQKLKDAKVDIYVKAYTLPALAKAHWNGSADGLKAYLEQSDKLLQSMAGLTQIHLEEAKPTPLDAPTLQSLAAAHTAWAQASATAAQDAGESRRPMIQKMNNAMNSAKASLDEYKKNPSAAMLWQVQTYMLQFILQEKELLAQIQAS